MCRTWSVDDDEEEAASPPSDLIYQFKVVLLGAPRVGKTTIASVAAGRPGQTCAHTARVFCFALRVRACVLANDRPTLCRLTSRTTEAHRTSQRWA
jgi:hypothetical protein